ncbi:473_t:CDS:2 [Scutellospora calospora]|uniref:473_t:CDS:1 n=1 Tax=Scutellospora calospora TaxID=85575 RepID=A0ACA9LSB7_9GLOM|nr:473_t:CDS:2 [Scutellospora calospora]
MSRPKINILIGATGSVASIKIPLLVRSLLQYENVEIKVVSTDNALHFFNRESLTKESGVEVTTDADEWKTCILRAWDVERPVIVCPAMNTFMWDHPFTSTHLRVLNEQLGYQVISPVSKKLACGDIGIY